MPFQSAASLSIDERPLLDTRSIPRTEYHQKANLIIRVMLSNGGASAAWNGTQFPLNSEREDCHLERRCINRGQTPVVYSRETCLLSPSSGI
jgi:hypothetical protein